jgi:DNA-binding NtrC family response regulator
MQTHVRTQVRAQIARTAILVSADAPFRHHLSEALTGMRWQVREAAGGAEALTYLEERPSEALLLDSWLPDLEAQELASYLRQLYPTLDLIRIDGTEPSAGPARSSRRNELLFALHRVREESDLSEKMQGPVRTLSRDLVACVAPRGIRSPQAHGFLPAGSFLGAKNTLQVPWLEGLSPTEKNKTEMVPAPAPRTEKKKAPGAGPALHLEESEGTRPRVQALPEMVGNSAAMQLLAQRARLVAPRRTTVLIEGPTGSGKELVARALHQLSARADRPFIVLNCAAVPEQLLEAELFGHTRGAFTGAVQARVGRIEAAHGGTLLLDEIGEMPLALQPKLLRFLEAGEVQRIGENQPVKVDVRVIAATHQPLARRSEEGSFRQDLFYRLSVFTLHTVPLVECPEDIPLLTEHFLARLAQNEPAKRFDDGAMECLRAHNWPGNVRELAHVVERAYILAEDRPWITAGEICFA